VCAGWEKGTNYFKLIEELKNSLLQRVHRAKDPNNQRLFENFPQGVRAGTLLEALSSQEISEGIEPSKGSNKYGGQNHLTEVNFRRKDTNSFGQKSLRS
jgi:hypothetical protein